MKKYLLILLTLSLLLLHPVVAFQQASQQALLGKGGAAAPFSPTDISGLKLWLKADALVLSNGDPVGTWTDSSGSGNDATQSSSSLKPTYITGVVNSKPVVRYDGSDDDLDAPDFFTSGQSFSIFVVCRVNSVGGYHALLQKGGTADQKVYLLQEPTTGDLYRWSGFHSSYSFTASTWVLVGYTHSASSDTNATETMYANGVQKGTRTGTVPAYNSSVLNIGTAAGFFSWDGDFAEIIIYNSALGTTDRQSVETYLNGKYAIY